MIYICVPRKFLSFQRSKIRTEKYQRPTSIPNNARFDPFYETNKCVLRDALSIILYLDTSVDIEFRIVGLRNVLVIKLRLVSGGRPRLVAPTRWSRVGRGHLHSGTFERQINLFDIVFFSLQIQKQLSKHKQTFFNHFIQLTWPEPSIDISWLQVVSVASLKVAQSATCPNVGKISWNDNGFVTNSEYSAVEKIWNWVVMPAETILSRFSATLEFLEDFGLESWKNP